MEPGIPRRNAATYNYLANFLPKTTWKLKKLDRGGRVSLTLYHVDPQLLNIFTLEKFLLKTNSSMGPIKISSLEQGSLSSQPASNTRDGSFCSVAADQYFLCDFPHLYKHSST